MLIQYCLFSVVTTVGCVFAALRATKTVAAATLISYFLSSRLNVLLLLNFVACSFICFVKAIEKFFFGSLREAEVRKVQERMLNFVLFKLMFIVAVLEQHVGDFYMWMGWFSVVGLLKMFSLLVRDRIEHLASNGADLTRYRRPLVLLGAVFVANLLVAGLGVALCRFQLSFSLLLMFDCFGTFVETLHTFGKFAIFHHDLNREGNWEEKGHYVYYLELSSESIVLLATFLHYMHIFFLLGISFTLINVVLLLNARAVYHSLQKKFYSYRAFVAMEKELRERYLTVDGAELGEDEVCAICRERMDVAKQLPCRHYFHLRCIRAWLEQNQHNCPICRHDLRKGVVAAAGPGVGGGGGGGGGVGHGHADDAHDGGGGAEAHDHGDADGGFLNWMFSDVLGGGDAAQDVERVSEMFPNVSREVIAADLRRTGSIDETIENIIEGRLPMDVPVALNGAAPDVGANNNNNNDNNHLGDANENDEEDGSNEEDEIGDGSSEGDNNANVANSRVLGGSFDNSNNRTGARGGDARSNSAPPVSSSATATPEEIRRLALNAALRRRNISADEEANL